METIDDETTKAAIDFMQRQVKAGKPFFIWMNTTRMHVFTHVRPEYAGKSGMPGNEYADGMWEHDQDVGLLLKAVDDLGIANDTIVIYTTDNGPNMFSWPDAAMTPFRSEKDSNWEGAFRVPAMVRWPGRIKPGQISNEMVSGMDWFPTLLSAAGDTTVKERLLKGCQADRSKPTYKVHLDGYNILPYLEGKEPKSPRHEFFYFNDDGVLVAMRNENWKFVFCEQRAPGNLNIWQNPFTCLRLPKVFNLRMDPVRAGRHHLRPVLRLACQERVPHGPGDDEGCGIPRDLRGIPAPAEAGELQRGPDHGGRHETNRAGEAKALTTESCVQTPVSRSGF